MRKIFTWKKIVFIYIPVILVVLAIFALKNRQTEKITTEKTVKKDIAATVLATGQVTSSTDVSLSFKSSGIVKRIPSFVGKKVQEGEILAVLDQKNELARLTQASGSLAQARANLEKVKSGASDEQVQVAMVALENAKKNVEVVKKQNDIAVKNAKSAMLSSGLIAETTDQYNASFTAPTITGTYMLPDEGQITMTYYTTGDGGYVVLSGVVSGNVSLTKNIPAALGNSGLFVTFANLPTSSQLVWTISIPNKKSASFVTLQNSYMAAQQARDAAVSAAESAVATAEAQLSLTRAQARPADIQAAQAGVLAAQGQVAAASADLENTIVRAPANGTVTRIDVKLGEQATSLKGVIGLQDIENLYVEANVSEANIADIKQGMTVEYTFDSLEKDKTFTGTVSTIDPASTVISGVVNYKVKATIPKVDEVKPGMTANMTFKIFSKPGVIAIPQRAVIEHDGKKFIRVVTDIKKNLYEEREVTLGARADGGVVEVLSGAEEGQEIVTQVTKK